MYDAHAASYACFSSGVGTGGAPGGWLSPLFYVRFNKVRGYTIARACNSNWCPPILMYFPTPLFGKLVII